MPKKQPLPEYETDQITELIRQHIHDILVRKLLLLRLVDGYTFNKIGKIIAEEEGIVMEDKTIRTKIHKGEEILFKHIPG